MVSILTSTAQLNIADSLLQIGSAESPCEIVFGLNSNGPYSDQRFQNLCVRVPADKLALFLAQDTQNPNDHPQVKNRNEDPWIQIKVDTHGTDLRLGQLVRGVLCMIIVSPRPWTMDNKKGCSLTLKNVKIIEPKQIRYDFI